MPFVTASDGTELYYEVEGDSFPLVFTHGNMGFGQQFYLQTRIFRRRYCFPLCSLDSLLNYLMISPRLLALSCRRCATHKKRESQAE
jgi:hypothetical protein